MPSCAQIHMNNPNRTAFSCHKAKCKPKLYTIQMVDLLKKVGKNFGWLEFFYCGTKIYSETF